MEYRKFGNRYMVRMDPGEEILTKVKELCKAENITLGEFRGLGAANELELGLYDVTKKQYFKEVIYADSNARNRQAVRRQLRP